MILPASTSALITASLASPFSPLSLMTRLPVKPGRSLGESAVFIDGVGNCCVDPARFELALHLLIQISKSSRPWPGAVCTKPVPSSSVTWLAIKKRHDEIIALCREVGA